MKITKEEILEKVCFDLDKAKAAYQWLNEENNECKQDAELSPSKVVTPYTDGNGKMWVHVCAGDIDFLLDTEDLTDNEVTWEEGNKLAAEKGMRLNPKREFQLIGAFSDEINKCCEELGGKKLEGYYWIGEEYYGNNAWYFIAGYGILYYNYKMGSIGVRGALAFKKS